MNFLKTLLLTTILITTANLAATAQDSPQPRLSPVAIEQITVGDTYMKVVYGQPSKRNREVFGGLVPFNEVWRTGANEATEITFTGDVRFADKEIKAGIYSLFTIPGQESWTVILSSQLGEWGAYRYDENKDVLRVDVPVHRMDEPREAFTIAFDEDGSALNLMWDRTAVSVPIEVSN